MYSAPADADADADADVAAFAIATIAFSKNPTLFMCPARFCIFNNIAVAAAHAIEKYGLKRIAIIDYDVHHGNGTQHLFEDSDQVMFISIHQDSNYPVYSG